MLSPFPDMSGSAENGGARAGKRTVGLALCVACIFFGSCAENGMSNWISGFMEQALHIDKTLGDILGVAMFAVMLGLGRSLYGKFGKNIEKVLVLCMTSAALLYLAAALSPLPWIGLVACAMTGFATSMLWPGNLSAVSARFPQGGVFLFAMMAAGGDLGASVGPQMVGTVTDLAMAWQPLRELAASLGMTGEQFGMKVGILLGALFPLIGIFLALRLYRNAKARRQKAERGEA
jgi:MFS family permease